MTFKSIEKYPNSVQSLLPLPGESPTLSTGKVGDLSHIWGQTGLICFIAIVALKYAIALYGDRQPSETEANIWQIAKRAFN
jgi:hypothetical protein